MFREKTTVLDNKKVAPGHYILRLASGKIAKSAKPGQFVQLLCSDSSDPLLPRPFSFLTASKKDFSVLYHIIGKGTRLLSLAKKGDTLWTVGPLGNGFSVNRSSDTRLLVGGGVGIPPLYHLAENLVKVVRKENIHVFLGARDKSLLLCEKDFKKLGVNLHLATDNGSKGKKGFVTEILEDHLNRISSGVRIYTCGPTPMLKAVSVISQKYEVPCEVSVEEPMACGFGACIGCAIKVRRQDASSRTRGSADGEYRFAIACSEGPVFEAGQIVWE